MGGNQRKDLEIRLDSGHNLSGDTTHLNDGTVGVSWKILEHDDGAVIQFILAGPSSVDIVPHGVVEGQQNINIVKRRDLSWILTILSMTVLGSMGLLINVVSEKTRQRYGQRSWRPFLTSVVIIVVCCLGLFAIIAYINTLPVPFTFD